MEKSTWVYTWWVVTMHDAGFVIDWTCTTSDYYSVIYIVGSVLVFNYWFTFVTLE